MSAAPGAADGVPGESDDEGAAGRQRPAKYVTYNKYTDANEDLARDLYGADADSDEDDAHGEDDVRCVDLLACKPHVGLYCKMCNFKFHVAAFDVKVSANYRSA